MTSHDLHALLTDPARGGSYFIDVHDREPIEDAARAAAYAIVPIDCAGCSEHHEILDRFAAALRFPDWFGGNWDALADCLGDLSWWPADGYLLLLDHVGAWRTADEVGFATLLDVLDTAAAAWVEAGVPFWALIAQPTGTVAASCRSLRDA